MSESTGTTCKGACQVHLALMLGSGLDAIATMAIILNRSVCNILLRMRDQFCWINITNTIILREKAVK